MSAPEAFVCARTPEPIRRGLHVESYSVLNKLLAPCLTATAVLVSIQTLAAPEPGFPTFSPPPVADIKGQALFKERCSICHDQKESRAPATAYLSTRLPSEIIYTLTKGEMINQAAGLSDDEIHSLARFLTAHDL